MPPPQQVDQHEAEPIEHTPPSERSILSGDPAVLSILLVYALLFSSLIVDAWLWIVGVVGLGLLIRWIIFWYEKCHRRDS